MNQIQSKGDMLIPGFSEGGLSYNDLVVCDGGEAVVPKAGGSEATGTQTAS